VSNVHYDLFCLADFPTDITHPLYLTGLDRQLLGHICTRFNENAVPPKAWPGEAELKRITGGTPEGNSRSIGRLVSKGFVHRVTKPSKGNGRTRGNRSEVAPNLNLIASHVHITDGLSIANKKVLKLYEQLTAQTSLDNPATDLINPGDAVTYPTGYAKRIEPNNLNKRIETKRWLIITSKIPPEYRSFINPGQNYETLLDQCNANGHSNEDIANAVGRINFYSAYTKGGLLNDVLQGLAGVKTVRKSKSGLVHCGDTFCDPVTRTFPEPSEINGRLDSRCPNCNEQLVNETKRRNDPPPFDFSALQNFGKLPDD
jgi:hypothetical protein